MQPHHAHKVISNGIMGPLSLGLVLLPVLWIASHLWALYHNYKAARATGLPLIVLPFDPENVRPRPTLLTRLLHEGELSSFLPRQNPILVPS